MQREEYAVSAKSLIGFVKTLRAGAALKANNGTLFRIEDAAIGMWLQYVEQNTPMQVNRMSQPR